MVEDNYEDGQDIMEIDFSDLNQGRRGRDRGSARNPSDPGKRKKSLVFGGAALLIIIIIAVALLAGNGSSGKPIAAIQARVEGLEEKVAHLSDMESNIDTVQRQEEALRQSVSRLQSSIKALKGTVGNISREVALLKKGTGTIPGRTKNTRLTRKKRTDKTHPRYHIVRKGESLYKIAKKYGISVRELYRLNNLSQKSIIHPGQKLLVVPGSKK